MQIGRFSLARQLTPRFAANLPLNAAVTGTLPLIHLTTTIMLIFFEGVDMTVVDFIIFVLVTFS